MNQQVGVGTFDAMLRETEARRIRGEPWRGSATGIAAVPACVAS